MYGCRILEYIIANGNLVAIERNEFTMNDLIEFTQDQIDILNDDAYWIDSGILDQAIEDSKKS